MTFRQKILTWYLVLFFIILAILFPYATKSVKDTIKKNLKVQTQEIINRITKEKNTVSMIKSLKERSPFLFFRVMLLDSKGKLLFDSHGPNTDIKDITLHPEIQQALTGKGGYYEDYSYTFQQQFAYVAESFQFHNKTYILRTAIPLNYLKSFVRDFRIAFLTLGIGVLVLFFIMAYLIINHLSRPIQNIIRAIKPYQEGKQDHIQQIVLNRKNATQDFVKLAQVLNSLSEKIKIQISTLTRERNETQAVLNSLIEGIIAVDSNLQITFINEFALKILNLKEEDILGKDVKKLQQEAFIELLTNSKEKGKIINRFFELVTKRKEKIPLNLIAAPKGHLEGAILVLQDNSSHFQIVEMGKGFIANASHELKTPITIIRGFAETLHEHPHLSKEIVAEVTSKIVLNCHRMNNLIKNLLILADLENLPHSRLVQCNLITLLEECKHQINILHADSKISIVNTLNTDPVILADSDLLELAFMNLLENACKYSYKNADISIVLEKEENSIHITFQDKGIGIPQADLPYIFQRFYTVDKAHSRRLGGAGLGLSIVDTIINKHSGKIHVESTIGEGTAFSIHLPILT